MKVLLQKPVPSLGRVGDIVETSDAYARNFLIPKGFAVIATPDVLTRHQAQVQKKAQAIHRQQADVARVTAQLAASSLTISGRANPQGKLFAAIKTADVLQAIHHQLGVDLSNATMKPDHLKTLGAHNVELRLDAAHTIAVTITISHGD